MTAAKLLWWRLKRRWICFLEEAQPAFILSLPNTLSLALRSAHAPMRHGEFCDCTANACDRTSIIGGCKRQRSFGNWRRSPDYTKVCAKQRLAPPA